MPVDLAQNLFPWRSGDPHPLQNWLISDPLYNFYPYLVHAVDTLRKNGEWPLWNPYVLLGHPVFANPNAQHLYPVFVLLGLLAGAARGWALGLWLHALLAAGLTYGFLREFGCSRRAAILGGFTYALSGYMVIWFESHFRISTLSWLPGVLWAFECAVHRYRFRYVVFAALAMALAILGGQLQFVATFSLFLSFYAIGRILEAFQQHPGKTSFWPLVVFGSILGLGILLASVQIWPFAEFLGLSHRSDGLGLQDPLPWRQLITLIIPDFYGNPASIGPYWGAINFSEGTIYAGLPALVLAILSPFCNAKFRVRYLSLLTILMLLFIIGAPGVQLLNTFPLFNYTSLHRSTFLLPLLVALLAATTLSAPQIPIRAALITSVLLCVSVGAAFLGNWGEAQTHWLELRRPIFLFGTWLFATFLLLTLRAYLPTKRNLVDWAIVVLVFVDLYTFGSHFNPTGAISELLPPTPAIEFLQTQVGLHRVVAYQRDDQVLFGPSVLSLYGIAEPGGYSSLIPERYRALIEQGDPNLDVWWMVPNRNIVAFSYPSRRLLDILGVAYAISPTSLTDPILRAEIAVDDCVGDSGEIKGTHVVRGQFTVRDTAINRVDLHFRVYQPEQASGILVVRMWRGSYEGQLIMENRVDATLLQDKEKISLYLSPEFNAPGHVYTWEIAPDDGTLHTGVGLCTDAAGQPAIAVYGADWMEIYQGEVFVHQRLAPLPRAYIVYATEYIPDDAQAVRRLLDESFDLRNVAITAERVNLPATPLQPATPAEIVTYKDTQIVIRTVADTQGLLVLSDQFYPGWQAFIDGEPASIVRVNHVLRGVIMPPGEHQVIFRFAPGSLRFGGLLSLLGIIISVSLIIWDDRLSLNLIRLTSWR
ncbi:YfhO family protein [Litorilinea aerophila]|nr:YfhO family protein [Litorilinea aerophila]MCC9078536.1 YfhO family protein [Litorilinea aerophila]